jgi:hypothetical protein
MKRSTNGDRHRADARTACDRDARDAGHVGSTKVSTTVAVGGDDVRSGTSPAFLIRVVRVVKPE